MGRFQDGGGGGREGIFLMRRMLVGGEGGGVGEIRHLKCFYCIYFQRCDS